MNDYKKIIKECVSKTDFALKLGYKHYNGRIAGIINKIIKDYNLDIFHFRKNGGGLNKKYEFIEKTCPVCLKIFVTQQGRVGEKTTCSHSCSNKFFSDRRWKDEDLTDYTVLCFRHHEKKCVYCGETLIVAVHHYDENPNNNSPENLIPLCPTHHQYWHSKYKHIVENVVVKYRENFIKNRT
jgi:hypothetical protein